MNQELKVKNLKKSYGQKSVLNGISLGIKRGEIVGLLGPNGAGKTTCFYILVGMITPDAGEVSLDEELITRLPIHKRAKKGLSYLPQEMSIFRKLTTEENILAILELRKELNKKSRFEKLHALLKDFNLTHLAKTVSLRLSGGERRRLEIARALAIEPSFILLDEPFAGVDPISVSEIKQIIRTMAKRNIGVLITDHNVRETLDICGRAYIISQGQVLCQGNPQTILNDRKVRDAYLGEQFTL